MSNIKKIIKAILPYGLVNSVRQTVDAEGKHKEILEVLSRDYSSIISDYKNRPNVSEKPESPYPVWVCWWQGEAGMPEVVKICYSQLLKNANGHKINLITKDNYKNHVSIPDYILEKVDSGIISITHFSDILRVALLSKYGGLWIDSTIYTLCGLPDFNAGLFSIRRLQEGDYVSECRWTAFLIYAEKSCMLLEFMQDIFFEYWKTRNSMIDYFLVDYCIMLAYQNVPEIHKMINNIPFSNPYLYWLSYNMNLKYKEQLFSDLENSTQFCKLTNKKEYKEKTKDGLLTNYGHIKNMLQLNKNC